MRSFLYNEYNVRVCNSTVSRVLSEQKWAKKKVSPHHRASVEQHTNVSKSSYGQGTSKGVRVGIRRLKSPSMRQLMRAACSKKKEKKLGKFNSACHTPSEGHLELYAIQMNFDQFFFLPQKHPGAHPVAMHGCA